MTENLTADQIAAQARIAAHMAQIAANKAAGPPADTRIAVPATAPAGWSNAAAHRAGRPTRSQAADYRRGYTMDEGVQTWDYS